MKNIKTKLNTGFILLSVFAFLGVLVVPLVPTNTAYAAACDSRTIFGTVVVGAPPVQAKFEYGANFNTVSNGGGIATPVQIFNTVGTFPVQAFISGLSENTTYYYRIATTGGNGTGNGAILSFTTPSCAPTQNPTVNITVDNSSVPYNGSTTVRWRSDNATSCTANGGVNGWAGSKNLSGSFATGSLTSTTTYNITCSNGTGSASDSVTVSVGNTQNNPTVNIDADDSSIDSGDSTTIRWNSDNADTCRASGGRNGWSGNRNLDGSFYTGSLYDDTTFRITCENENGTADDSVTVRVDGNNNDDPTVNIYASPSNISYNGSSTITWNSNNADYCTASGGTNGWSGNRNTSGTFYTGIMTNSRTFSISCRNNSGSAYDSTIVNVISDVQPENRPTVVIYADQSNVAYNGATTVRWSTTNATSCNASNGSVGWAGAKSIGPGSFYTGSLTGTRTYTITCSNNAGSASDFTTVNVRGQVLGATTTPSAYLVVNSSVDRNRPIIPTLDNTNPCPGDEINYTLTYQNIGNGSVRNLVLRIDLPSEVTYLSANPSNPSLSGNTLIFNLGTLGANKSGTVTVRVLLRDNVSAGTSLNFPATLNYIDPSGNSQSVSANVSATVCGQVLGAATTSGGTTFGAAVFGAGFLPTSIVGWLLLLILILVLILLAKYLFGQSMQKNTVVYAPPTTKRTTTTTTQ